MSGTTLIPINLGPEGQVPQTPANLQAQLIANVTATNPDYTANLPGTLIEDISSTCVGALALIDSCFVDLINSLNPATVNQSLLIQLGNVYGTSPGLVNNTSVYVVFTATGAVGLYIQPGFTVGDGINQYVVQDGGQVLTGGSTAPLFCVAVASGTFAVPANTVTQIQTSTPGITITCNNPQSGVPGSATETPEAYQARVLTTGLGNAQGSPNYLKGLLLNIPGVQPRLVSVQQGSSQWKVICGGGDPYAVAGAIYQGTADISTLIGSATTARNITVNIIDIPDTYSIIFVNPPQLNVIIQLTWNTTETNYVNPAAVSSLGATALLNYINSLAIGQQLNLFVLQEVFQSAVSSIVPAEFLSRMVFTVTIGGTVVTPTSGTGLYASDLESFLFTTIGNITVSQG